MTQHQRYVCIHGHFYQPPRENPWLEAIEVQDSAHPFHDWNERITAECYSPNSAARIQDNQGRILGIVNNYARISFNFGPTLLSWMENHSPAVYASILEADKLSMDRYGGHGSALAQVYNHIIMPLANRRDRETQIVWGLRDFEERFQRKPEGMWLAETAVDLPTLERLAENNIKFTVLAPNQAARIRPRPETNIDTDGTWQDVTGSRIDPARAYLCRLPNGKSISLFFYDGPISRAVAFEGILRSGETFAERLLSGFSDGRRYPQLLHIATDGETYGHHHKFGDMALAYAMHHIEQNNLAKLTNYGQYLELCPPEWEVQIVDNSSWSCAHGVERWNSDCGCNSGGRPGWSQEWRQPLRSGLNWLRDSINPLFEQHAVRYFGSPWKARDGYISVLLNRTPETINQFLSEHATHPLAIPERSEALRLMEIQRQLLLMYTSCGWFFDELSGIETVQIMQYASRAIQLAQSLFGQDFEPGFKQRLSLAHSNLAEHVDGQDIYNKYVKPAAVDLQKVGSHYAVSSLFNPDQSVAHIYAFTVRRLSSSIFESGLSRLAVGKALVVSDVTLESLPITYCVLHIGAHNLTAGVRGQISDEQYDAFLQQIQQAFQRGDLAQVYRIIDRQFEGATFSLGSLFKDEREKILQEILQTTLEQAKATLRLVFESNAALMTFLTSIGTPQPEVLKAVGRFVMGSDLKKMLEQGVPDPDRLSQLAHDARLWHLPLNADGVEIAMNQAIEATSQRLSSHPTDLSAVSALLALLDVADQMPFGINFWQAQNVIYGILQTTYQQQLRSAGSNTEASTWIASFKQLAQRLKVKIDESR